MVPTTLCYIEDGGRWLMLHRVKKKNDLNEGKWIGVGGHVEAGETPEMCVRREVTEETGLTLGRCRLRGVVDFLSDRWPAEAMYLYTSDDFTGTLTECDEGDLRWIRKEEVFSLPLWDGDRVFLSYLLENEPFFHLELHYDRDDRLISDRLLPPVILASASPRRLALLRQIGIEPAVLPGNGDEHPEGASPDEVVIGLSLRKADAAADLFRTGCASAPRGLIIIGADTIVTVDGTILGKPSSHAEAASMIGSLAGRAHEVFTGVTILRCREQDRLSAPQFDTVTFAEKTTVHVSPMDEEEILSYAETDEPMDKAGAYGIQGPFAAFVRGIEGDYCSVVGLPVSRVYHELKRLMPG